MAGVIVFKGMRVGVLPGDLQISVSETGDVESKLILSTAYNVLPIWLRIAHDQLAQAKAANTTLLKEWGRDDNKNRELLVKELEASLLVFVACGVVLDALYDQVRPHAKLPKEMLEAWKENGTSRTSQICETLRRVYRLDADMGHKFRNHIEAILRLRDQAVHPSLELKQSRPRPDIPVGVDWKFAAYRCTNASACFESTTKMLIYIYERKSGNANLDKQMENVFEALIELGVVRRKSVDGGAADGA